MKPLILTERLCLRMWKDTDTFPFAQMNKDADVMKYFPKILTEEETAAMVDRIKAHFQQHVLGYLLLRRRPSGSLLALPDL